jgi:hypothetical protein
MEKKNVNKDTDYAMINSILNPDDGKLPFGYYAPEMDGKVTWNCGTDQNGDIISVFCHDDQGNKDKKISKLKNMDDANYAKNELIKAGWLKIKPPEITVTYGDGSKKPASRKQKRSIKKNLQKMDKVNPFNEDKK